MERNVPGLAHFSHDEMIGRDPERPTDHEQPRLDRSSGETDPSTPTSSLQNGTARARRHTASKSVLLRTLPIIWLVCTLHHAPLKDP